MMSQLLLETGNNPAMAQRLVNIFSGQGTEVEHNTGNSAAAQIPMPPLETRETSPTNPGPAVNNETGVAAGHEPERQPPPTFIDEEETPDKVNRRMLEAGFITQEELEEMGRGAGQIEVPA